ncbi:hypothetical protein GP486_000809 [Trichoglossum hirsutum]|uniref:RNase MRP protein 1 RNA binding domain-containing protein n=1 Tax=Trichoglossum hirsutum TaxID=265104 RepID=A0A9P8LI30_9PEZI|nr:hypothetical protein GP486_000809 [Trichoglossum hirsutum]
MEGSVGEKIDAETENSAFSNIIADTQFSAMGLVLMAILARINRVIHADAEPRTQDVALELPTDEDLGEAVVREVREDDGQRVDAVSDGASFEPVGVATDNRGASTPRSKRRRGKSNAIDDLFSAIL